MYIYSVLVQCITHYQRLFANNAPYLLFLAGSTSSFIILGSELREGINIIGLRISANGVVRTTTLTAQKTRGEMTVFPLIQSARY